jgi:hypothetical protein
VDANSAHKWRAEFLSKNLRDPIDQDKLEAFSHIFTEHMMTSGLQLLIIYRFRDQAFQDLKEIVKRNICLSSKLWQERTRLVVMKIDDLSCRPFRYVDSDEGNCTVFADRSYKLDDSKNPQKCDGQYPWMVIQPAIVAYGDENGENYDQEPKVWLPAMVRFHPGVQQELEADDEGSA